MSPQRENTEMKHEFQNQSKILLTNALKTLNSYNELKESSFKQIHNLRNGNDYLTAKTTSMERKIALFRHLLFFQDIHNHIEVMNPVIAQGHSHNKPSPNDNIRSDLLTEDEPPETDVRVELKKFKTLTEGLKIELRASKNELARLKQEYGALKDRNIKMEEDLWASKIQIMDFKSERGMNTDGYFSPLNRLEAMKRAFDKNEQIIRQLKTEIQNRDVLITEYAKYCGFPKVDSNNNMGHVHNCRDTVKSLAGHIEKLIEVNDKCREKMPNSLLNDNSSNLSSEPYSSDSTTASMEKVSSLLDQSQGCGDVNNHVVLQHVEISPSVSKVNPKSYSIPRPLPSSMSGLPLEQLSAMTQSAQRLGQSSQDIISATLQLLDMQRSGVEAPQSPKND